MICCTKKNKPLQINDLQGFNVPGTGLEPARPEGHRPLKTARLPIPPPGQGVYAKACDPGRARTCDPLIKSQMLCQLSYGIKGPSCFGKDSKDRVTHPTAQPVRFEVFVRVGIGFSVFIDPSGPFLISSTVA